MPSNPDAALSKKTKIFPYRNPKSPISEHTCHMHEGTSKGPRTKAGKERSRLAVLKHGNHTKEAKAEYQEVMTLIQQSKDRLKCSK